jgi:type II secretory pathway pseudopilin PulG
MRISRQKGLTLVEVLVPMVIIAMAIVGLLTSFIMGRLHTTMARHRSEAINLLRARIEEVRSRGYDYLNAFHPNPSVETNLVLDEGPDRESPHDDLTCARTTQVTDNDADGTLEITVTVTWSERLMSGNENFSESLFTMVAPTRGSSM